MENRNQEGEDDRSELRRRAEERHRSTSHRALDLSPEEMTNAIHELEVHKIELEMQNEALRSAQQEIEASRDKYFDLFDFAPIGYFTFDEKGCVLEANLTFCNMLGLARSVLIGKSANLFLPGDDLATFQRHRSKAWASHLLETCEVRLKPWGRPEVVTRMEMLLAGGETDRPTMRVAVVDITERRAMEEELDIYRSHLEQLVYQRTTELSETVARLKLEIAQREEVQEQLKAAKEAAETANLSKSQFLATMSHEIRTPMNGILGMAQLLMTTDLTERQKEFAGTLFASAESLLGILNDILHFAKLEADRFKLHDTAFDLISCIEECVSSFGASTWKRNLELIVHMDPRLPFAVRGDAGRLRQILVNIVGNSVKFTERGEIIVDVSLAEDAADHFLIGFEVLDTGIGMSSEDLGRAFEVFFQADSSMSRKYGGTGLGLSIARELVEMMGGSIRAESEAGKGSTFQFTVRLGKEPGLHAPPLLPPPELAGKGLLLADDNGTCLSVLSRQLEEWGMFTDQARSGQAALDMIRRRAADGDPYHAALVDWTVEDMNGIQLLRAICSDPALSDLVAILLVPGGQREVEDAVDEVGVSSYLTKPLRPNQLLESLVSTLAAPMEKRPKLYPAAPSHGGSLPARILVAEDNLVNMQVLKLMLEQLGHTVDAAVNGADALEMMRRNRYALVLMDCHMPGIDGYEATIRIRQEEKKGLSDRIPVIAITADAMEENWDRCRRAGMDGYLAKPFHLEQLRATLAPWLPRR